MPVPVWDCTDMSLLEEPLDSVLSDDIWKKFDLDEPLDAQYIYGHQNPASLTSTCANGHTNGTNDKTLMTMMMSSFNNHNSNMMSSGGGSYEESMNNQAVSLPEFYDKISCRESREIRHHDCMWAGLCISKEHNRTLPAKKDAIVNSKKVAAGRSLLISSRTTINSSAQQTSNYHQQISSSGQQQSLYQQQQQQQRINKDGLESDGDSARPETPQSSESEIEDEENEDEDDQEEEEEDEIDIKEEKPDLDSLRNSINHVRVKHEIEDGPLVFKHDQISINDKLSECMSDEASSNVVRSAPVSEVTGQVVRKSHHHLYPHHHHHNRNSPHHHHLHHQNNVKVKIEVDSDHCPYESNDQQQRIVKNEPDNWNTLNDHCYHQPSSKKLEHLGVQTPSDSEEEIDVVTFEKPCRPAALPTYPSIADQQHFQLTVKSALKEKPVTAPRPRGRPPSSGTPRKRSAPNDSKPTKRAKHRSYQSRSKVTKNNSPPTPAASPLKSSSPIESLQASVGATAGTSRSSSSDDEPDTEKRSLHNNMERQRRIELRNAFEDLRLLVPEIEDKEKAPKVAILRQAAIYCDKLTEIDRATIAKVMEMKRRQERLRARLSQLRRSLAMTR